MFKLLVGLMICVVIFLSFNVIVAESSIAGLNEAIEMDTIIINEKTFYQKNIEYERGVLVFTLDPDNNRVTIKALSGQIVYQDYNSESGHGIVRIICEMNCNHDILADKSIYNFYNSNEQYALRVLGTKEKNKLIQVTNYDNYDIMLSYDIKDGYILEVY
jgi:hypothetical protein